MAGIHRRFFLGGGFYTEKEMWHKRMFLLKSFTSPCIHKPHIKGEEWFSDSGLPPQLLPIFCVARPNCQLLPGIQFLGCSATFQGSPCLPVELSWFMNFITHWSHEPCQICHKLFILVKNHVSKKSEICVFFMTWMIELWWIIECVGESKRHIPPPRS